jgi:hypothetical protein
MHGQQSTHSGRDTTSSTVIVTTGQKIKAMRCTLLKSKAKLIDFHD